jgi:allophanate hydrolase subunit 2
MGSLSTYIDGKLGGFNGRTLLKGDYLSPFEYRSFKKPITIAQLDQPRYSSQVELRVLDGPQFTYFGSNVRRLFQEDYRVSDKTDRTGCCLDGPSISTMDGYRHTIISEPVVRGNIQIPPDGKPIVLWSEQTVGSYAKIATVITPDLPLLAQAIPGDKIYFRRIDLNTAHILYRKWYADHMRSIG